MASTKNENVYTLMAEYDFDQPINATIIFDSDENESNQEINSLPETPEKHDGDHQKVTKYLDMPSLDGQNSTTEETLDDVVTKVIKKYICKTTKASDKKPPKRKSSTTSKTIKNKLKPKNNEIKKKINQHNEPSFSSPNDYKNCQLASNQLVFSAKRSKLPNNVSSDIRSQDSSCISSSPSNIANQQPMMTLIEPKIEPIEDTNSLNYLSKELTSQRNTSTSGSPPYTDKSQPISTYADQNIEPIQDSQTSPNIASEGIKLDTSKSSSPTNSYNRQPSSKLKSVLTGDSNPQSNLSYEITNQQHILSTSNLPPNTGNRQSIPVSTEQSVKSAQHSWTSVNDVSEEMRNGIDKKGHQLNTPISGVPANTDSSCPVTNMSEEIKNQPNPSSSNLPTNTNNTQPVSTDVTSKNQTLQNNDNSRTYDHLKPLLDTVSEHLILIWKRTQSCNDVLKGGCQQNYEFREELEKKIYQYKIRLFDLSYSTVVNVILPRVYDKTFVKNFIDNTVALSKSENRQTTKEISMLYMEMIHWVHKMKQRIASESAFDNEIIRQPTATDTSGLPRTVNESSNPHSTYNYTYSVRPPETQRSPPWVTRSNPPPPYPYNLRPSYTNNIPQYINTQTPQTCVNNVITPAQTTVINSKHSEHQQLSTEPIQKKKGKLNQKQVTVAEVTRRAVNPTYGSRQDFYSPNNSNNSSNNNHNVNLLSNPARGSYQNYQPTYFPAVPNPNHAGSVCCINNSVSANNGPQPRSTAESEYQKFLHASRPRILPNNNTSSENQNHFYRPSDTSSQGTNNHPNNAQVNNIQQEPDRSSISRDSGFYSPRHFEQEPSTSPLITHVTSLNPDAVYIAKGSCFVCGKNTNQMCVGCYATYYCSYGCQNFDWQNHILCCNTNKEIRRLLSK